MSDKEWLILNYTLPREPSRTRVNVWRKLNRVGAAILGQSMWLLPYELKYQKEFEAIASEIEQNNGTAFIMRSQFLNENHMESAKALLNEARNREYREFIEKCDDFYREINKEEARNNYTFAEIEENEHELEKLAVWLEKIVGRDFFGAALKEQCSVLLTRCRIMLEEFSGKVYDLEISDKS